MADFYLKILTGNHIGAEIPIRYGEYIIGRSIECDIVLTDDILNENELRVTIKENSDVFVETLSDNSVIINGNVAGIETKVHFYDPFTTNNIFFAIGPANEIWPNIKIPEAVFSHEDIEVVDNKENKEQANLEDDDDDLSTDKNDNDDFKNKIKDNKENIKPSANINNKKKKWYLFTLLSIIIILLINQESFIFNPTQEQNDNKFDSIAIAKQIKNELNLKAIKFKQTKNNILYITGYCQSYTQERQLLRKLNKNGISYDAKIFVMNDIFEKAKIELDLITQDDKVRLEKDNTPGNLILTGYSNSIENTDEIISTLKRKVDGLVTIIDQVETFDARFTIIKNAISQQGFSANIQVVPNDSKEVIIKGRLLEENQVYKLKKLINEFNKNHDQSPPIKLETIYAGNYINADSQAKNAIKLDIKSVNVGKTPHIILQDGSKYLIGSVIKGEYIIEDISIDSILLNKDNKRINFYLGGANGTEKKE